MPTHKNGRKSRVRVPKVQGGEERESIIFQGARVRPTIEQALQAATTLQCFSIASDILLPHDRRLIYSTADIQLMLIKARLNEFGPAKENNGKRRRDS